MKARIRLIIIAVAVAIIAIIVWLATMSGGSLLGEEYPGFINTADKDIPEEVRAQWQATINTAQAQLKLNPDNLNSMMTIAFWQKELGEYAVARRSIEQMLEENPGNATGWTILGDIAYDMEDWDTAEAAWVKSLGLYEDSNIYPKIERLWREHKPERIPDIRQLYEDAIQAGGQQDSYMAQLSQWYEENQMWSEAASHLQYVVTHNPDDEFLAEHYKELLEKAK